MRKIFFIARKELYHIRRDPRSLMIVILMPVMMTFLYGYAINMDIEEITIAIIDYDQSSDSRELVGAFFNSTYFVASETKANPIDPQALLRSNRASAILTIPPGFSKAMVRHEEFELGMLVDGSDASLAAAVQAYSEGVLVSYQRKQMPPDVTLPGIKISTQVKYNPDLKSAHFFIPGLVAIILMMICALLTSLTIAREKETGTMEQLLTAPVKPYQILLGKILPYVLISFFDGVLIVILALLVFGVPIVGSSLLLLLFGFIYVTCALSLGILISSVAQTQQVAMMMALTVTMLPSAILSGFIFALKNMPLPHQAISHIIPARYFIIVIRGIMLKGTDLAVLASQAGYLVLLATVLLFVATRKFKTTVG